MVSRTSFHIPQKNFYHYFRGLTNADPQTVYFPVPRNILLEGFGFGTETGVGQVEVFIHRQDGRDTEVFPVPYNDVGTYPNSVYITPTEAAYQATYAELKEVPFNPTEYHDCESIGITVVANNGLYISGHFRGKGFG